MNRRRQAPSAPTGFEVLNSLQRPRPQTLPKSEVTSDSQVVEVLHELRDIAGGASQLELKLAQTIRRALDLSYAGPTTGRFHLAQLSKTEKAHTGTLFEVELQNALDLPDGHDTDYQVLTYDVDAKFTHLTNGSPNWMIGPEIEGNIALLATASDYRAIWSAWLVWVTPDRRRAGANRDAKASLNKTGLAARVPIAVDAPLPPNNLLARPERAVQVMQSGKSGQERILDLCRLFEGDLLTRNTIATVAQQLDPTKRLRANGGARTRLASEGFLIVGHEAHYRPVVEALGLPQPRSGEFIPVRVRRAEGSDRRPTFHDSEGALWCRALTGEQAAGVPDLSTSLIEQRLANSLPSRPAGGTTNQLPG